MLGDALNEAIRLVDAFLAQSNCRRSTNHATRAQFLLSGLENVTTQTW